MASKQKSPILAAILGIFGPLAFFYFGWRHGISFLITWVVYVMLFVLFGYWFNLDSVEWISWINMSVFMWTAFFLAKDRNSSALDTYGGKAALNILFVLLAMATLDTILIDAVAGIKMIHGGHLVRGLLVLLIAAPIVGMAANYLITLIFTFLPLHVLLGIWSAKDLGLENQNDIE